MIKSRSGNSISDSGAVWDFSRVCVECDFDTLNSLATTGHKVWPAARKLASFLEKKGSEYGCMNKINTDNTSIFRRVRILELGSGTGWLGLTIADNIQNLEEIRLTEQEAGMGFLQRNIEYHLVNRRIKNSDRVTTSTFEWSKGAEALVDEAWSWDLIIGSDLVYNEEGCNDLPLIWKEFLTAASKNSDQSVFPNDLPLILYCHTKRRYEDLDFSSREV